MSIDRVAAMRTVARLLIFTFLAAALAVCAGIYLAVEDSPTVIRTDVLTPGQIERAKQRIAEHDPRKLKPGSRRVVRLAEADLDAGLDYLLSRTGRGRSEVELRNDRLLLRASFRLPDNPLGAFLNLQAELTGGEGMPSVAKARLGRLSIPPVFANWLLVTGLKWAKDNDGIAAVLSAVHSVRLRDSSVMVTYSWQSDLVSRVRRAILPAPDLERLRAHHLHLVETTGSRATRGDTPLREIMQSQFGLAAKRAEGNSAIDENRAAIVVLAFFVNGMDIGVLGEAARDWPRPAGGQPLLQGRDDFAQHFLTSAALAAGGSSALSDAVGVFKELEDSHGGSGFSFKDISADLAGTRFGSEAASAEASARSIQRRISSGLSDADIMPETGDLPEFLSAAEFRRRFTAVGAPAYNRLMAEIRRRVDELPLYR